MNYTIVSKLILATAITIATITLTACGVGSTLPVPDTECAGDEAITDTCVELKELHASSIRPAQFSSTMTVPANPQTLNVGGN